jgi:hypothetical protein
MRKEIQRRDHNAAPSQNAELSDKAESLATVPGIPVIAIAASSQRPPVLTRLAVPLHQRAHPSVLVDECLVSISVDRRRCRLKDAARDLLVSSGASDSSATDW